uniref:Kinesin family member 15 n=1 Tax=Cyprinus carpio TaxID=7962 RepID=A0A8C1ZDG9_CYPCA
GSGLTTDGDRSLCLTVTSPHTVRLHCKPEPRTFTYDHVADMNTSQEEVFSSVAKNIVESCMNGYNGTIFAYGQTGSGKTFTMLGPSELDNFSDELRGVIPRSFEYLFFLINREVERSGGLKSFLCKCSFIEIYNEQIYDLLDSVSTSLFLREDIKRGVFVEGAVEKYAASAAEAYQVLSMGWRNRRVASTSMNRESSRSHAVFTMTLESKETAQEVVNIRTSQLNLVDLAGSERQRDTHAEGSRLKEASSINRSLMCLGQVIMALMDVSNGKNRHICYRDSKLTFLLRDSLGGNAKTYIIANVHPGSKCFGETLSTLQFAQRAKLIKNKAMVNEDTQGNVSQLQAEVRKLKEQLAHALSQARHSDAELSYKTQFIQAMSIWKKAQEDKKALQGKVSQLEAAWAQKEKFIQSNRMILKFRDDHIAQLKKELQTGQRSDPDQQNQQLQEEIRLLREQVEHHPRMMQYAAENCALREEIQALRALDSVRSAVETKAQSLTALEKSFLQLLEAQRPEESTGAPPIYSTPVTMETLSSVSVERMKVQLLQKQSELTATIQAFEEYKEVNKKQLAELESEKRYLEKSNKHLEKILEATKAHSKQEVSQLNKIHAETIKEQALRVQGKLDEEEAKNRKLLQQISKLEEQVTVAAERSSRTEEQLKAVCCDLSAVLRVEVRDLRVVLQSSDKELEAARTELQQQKAEHESETTDLSKSLISTQLQLDTVKLEWKQVLEKQRDLQDMYDTLQAEFQFELDQHTQQISFGFHIMLRETRKHLIVSTSNTEKMCVDKGLDLTLNSVVVVYNDLTERSQCFRKFALISCVLYPQGKYSTVCTEKEQMKESMTHMQNELQELREASERRLASDRVELELLQEDLAYATDEVERLGKVLEEQAALLESSRTLNTEKENSINSLKEQVLLLESRRSSMITMEVLLKELNAERTAKNQEIDRLKVMLMHTQFPLQQTYSRNLTEIEVLRKQVDHLTEENGKLLGHQNPKQKIEYLVKLKKEITRLQEVRMNMQRRLYMFK